MRRIGRYADRRSKQRGAAAVELAMVLPLLCILLFGILSYGYMLAFRQALSQSAAEGARAAAVAPIGTLDAARLSKAQDAVNNGLASYGISCNATSGVLTRNATTVGTCTISSPQACTASSSSGSLCVRVTLDYKYRANSLIPTFPGFGIVLPTDLSYLTETEVTV